MTVIEYCQAMDRKEIRVNRDYQRSDRVWPTIARSYLVESLILGFPLPKFTHYVVTDVKSRQTYREIVDGQQRSKALHEFVNDKFPLSTSLESDTIRGRRYSELTAEDQEAFLTATLSLDQLVATTREEVREAFRRMNSYTVPLNAEEHRHAVYQGPFKWFLHRFAGRFNGVFVDIGLFNERQIVRMADTKLLAEACHGILYGITTTNKKVLDKLYQEHDHVLTMEDELNRRLTFIVEQIQSWEDIHHGNLMRPYVAYSLFLALTHVTSPVAALEPVFDVSNVVSMDEARVLTNLTTLSDALENPDEPGEFAPFVEACRSMTNVRSQREIRFRWMCDALCEDSLSCE